MALGVFSFIASKLANKIAEIVPEKKTKEEKLEKTKAALTETLVKDTTTPSVVKSPVFLSSSAPTLAAKGLPYKVGKGNEPEKLTPSATVAKKVATQAGYGDAINKGSIFDLVKYAAPKVAEYAKKTYIEPLTKKETLGSSLATIARPKGVFSYMAEKTLPPEKVADLSREFFLKPAAQFLTAAASKPKTTAAMMQPVGIFKSLATSLTEKPIDISITPKSTIGKTLFGEEKISGVKDINLINRASQTLQNIGLPESVASSIAQWGALPVMALFADPTISPANTKKVLERVAKSKNVNEIVRFLSPLFKDKAPQEIEAIAKKYVNITEPGKVFDEILKDKGVVPEMAGGIAGDVSEADLAKTEPVINTKREIPTTKLEAEEFVRAQDKVYHGTNNQIIGEIKPDVESPNQFYGQGIYFSTTEEGATKYGKNVNEYNVDTTEFLDLRGKSPMDRQMETGTFGTYEQFLETTGLKDTTKSFNEYKIVQKQVSDDLTKQGYKGIIDDTQIVVFDKSAIKTKSQLTDIWNKAQPMGELAPKVTTPKVMPKSIAEELLPKGTNKILSDAKIPETPEVVRILKKTAEETGDTVAQSSRVVAAIKAANESWGTRLIQWGQDQAVTVRKLMENPNFSLDDASNIYQKMILMPGRIEAQVAENAAENTKIVNTIKELADKNKTTTDEMTKAFDELMEAQHAPEFNAIHGEGAAGITTKEATEKAKVLQQSPYYRELQALADKVVAMNRATIDLLTEAGVVKKETRDLLVEKYKRYVPFQRVMEDTEDIGGALSARGYDVRSTGIRRAVGSKRKVTDIYANTIANYQQAIIRAEKNIVDNATLKFVEDNKDILGDLMEITRPKFIGKTIDGKPILERTNDPRILQLFKDGKPVWIRINDKRLAIALRGVGAVGMSTWPIVNAIGKFTRFYAGLATRFNPEFLIPNKIRDLQETMVYLMAQKDMGAGHALKTTMTDHKSLGAVRDWFNGVDSEGARLYDEMRKAGGTTGGFGLSTREQVKTDLDNLMRDANSSPRKALKNLVGYIDKWNSIFEDSTRLSVYRTARQAGVSKDRAAFMAKEASINFNKKGTAGSVINALYMFSNASIQGSAKMIRALYKNPKVLGAVILTMGAAVGTTNEWNDRVDPEWRNKVSEWDRANGLVLAIPFGEKGGIKYVVIPVSWGLKPIKVMADAADDIRKGHVDKDNWKATAKTIFTSIAEGYNPLGGSNLYSTIIPTPLDVYSEIKTNTSWTGNPIRPAPRAGIPVDREFFDSLSKTWGGKTAISLTEFLQDKIGIAISPANLKYAVDQYIGGAGRTASKVITLFNDIGKVVKGEKKPSYEEYPFISRFYRARTAEEVGFGAGGEIAQLKTASEEFGREKDKLKKEAVELFREWSQLSPAEANAKLAEMQKTNPRLADKIKEEAEDKKLGLEPQDKIIKYMGVQDWARSKTIMKQLSKMKTAEEKTAYWNDYVKKKIITAEVSNQIKYLMAHPEIPLD